MAVLSPAGMLLAIFSRTKRLQPKETEDPMATRVSMLGEPCIRDPKPLVKNFLLMHITTRASSIWIMARVM